MTDHIPRTRKLLNLAEESLSQAWREIDFDIDEEEHRKVKQHLEAAKKNVVKALDGVKSARNRLTKASAI